MTEKKFRFSQKYLCHAALGKSGLSLFFSDNNFCKVDVISVKSRFIMTVEKSYSDFFHTTTPAELRQSTFSPRIISSR